VTTDHLDTAKAVRPEHPGRLLLAAALIFGLILAMPVLVVVFGAGWRGLLSVGLLAGLAWWGLRELPEHAATVGPRWLVRPVWPTALLVAIAAAALLAVTLMALTVDVFESEAPLPPISVVPQFESLELVGHDACGGSACSWRSLTFESSSGLTATEALGGGGETLSSQGWSVSETEDGFIAEKHYFQLVMTESRGQRPGDVHAQLSFTGPEAAEAYDAEGPDLSGGIYVAAGLALLATTALALRILSGSGRRRQAPVEQP
jgi:hypothetical protein